MVSISQSTLYNRIVSRMYICILQSKSASTHIKKEWEKGGHLSISVESWERICQEQWIQTSSNTSHEFCWENIVLYPTFAKMTPRNRQWMLETVWDKYHKPFSCLLEPPDYCALLEIQKRINSVLWLTSDSDAMLYTWGIWTQKLGNWRRYFWQQAKNAVTWNWIK